MATPIIDIPTLTTSQSNKETTINEAIAFLESASVGLKAFTDTDTAASGLTVAGDDLKFGAYSFSGEVVAVDIVFPGTARTFAVWNKNTVTLTVSVDAGVITHDVEPDQIAWFVTDGSIALALAGGGSINNNYAATTDPGVNDDVDQTAPGPYSVGSTWVNLTLNTAFICVDSTNAAAVWNQIDASGTGPNNNYVATTNPTIDDDLNQSSPGPYSVGSKWVNVTLDTSYICVDNTDGAAVWNQIDAAGGGAAVSQYFSIVSFDYTTDNAIGNGAGYFHIPPDLNGMDLTYVHAEVITAGVTGTLDIQIHNVTDAVDMLSTKITIDTTETGSDTAATPAVIDTTNDDVATNDLIRVDVDAIHTGTAAKGLLLTLGFETP